jgi:TRAP-type C4-dicarboxylate transport system permease large subunit
MLPVVLLFGIYGGVMTPTEGAAAAAAYALLASALIYRSISFKQLYNILLSSAKSTTSVGMLIAGALVFNYVVTIENVPLSVQRFIAAFHLTPIGYLLLVNAICCPVSA